MNVSDLGKREVWESVGLSFVVLTLSLLVDVSNAPQQVLSQTPNRVFALLHYDLLLIAFSILGGSYLTLNPNSTEAKQLFLPMAVIFLAFILCLTLGRVAQASWMATWKETCEMWIPMVLGLFTVGFAVYFIKK